ncbi:MAG: hypothetical protein BWK76_15810 [Desulfobulbaceae bacterium A2]|nr:MAG: hypothetical protein BWK76_15810 [Desulfobulbaceae bacterium A2]
MEVYLARQPIFNRRKELYAYELLFRSSMSGGFPGIDGDQATSRILSSSFFTTGISKVSGGKPCFINFTQELLLQGIPAMLPRERVVVEVLEDVKATPEVVTACRELAGQGYIIALDDFVFSRDLLPLIELAHIIKIDFRQTPQAELKALLGLLPKNIKLLAEKIETYEEFGVARDLGFSYFQGYFFSRPEVLRHKDIAASKLNLFNLLTAINRPEIDFKLIERMIAPDVSLAYKLLRYINSAYYSRISEIKSVRQAVVYLGAQGTRQFVSLVAISALAADKPDELIRTSIVRARLCELLAGCGGGRVDGADLFLLGLFSLLDAMLDAPMAQLLESLPVAGEIKDALTRDQGPYAAYLRAAVAYEQGQWLDCARNLEDLGIGQHEMINAYFDALTWAEHFTDGGTAEETDA